MGQSGDGAADGGPAGRAPRLAAAVIQGRVGHAQAVVLTRLLDRLGQGELQYQPPPAQLHVVAPG